MKLFLLTILLLLFLGVQGQGRSVSATYDMSHGDTTITSINVISYGFLSIQMTATGLDAADATFIVQKSNDLINYDDVPSVEGIFSLGDSIRFIEFNNDANSGLRLKIVANSVTVGTLKINVNFIQK